MVIIKLREGLFPALISAVSHLIRVGELELPAVAGPWDELLAALVGEELQQELPQLDGARALVAGQQRGGDHRLSAHTLHTHDVTLLIQFKYIIFLGIFIMQGKDKVPLQKVRMQIHLMVPKIRLTYSSVCYSRSYSTDLLFMELDLLQVNTSCCDIWQSFCYV